MRYGKQTPVANMQTNTRYCYTCRSELPIWRKACPFCYSGLTDRPIQADKSVNDDDQHRIDEKATEHEWVIISKPVRIMAAELARRKKPAPIVTAVRVALRKAGFKPDQLSDHCRCPVCQERCAVCRLAS